MKYFYDRAHDSLSITLVDRRYVTSEEIWPGVIVDFDESGKPIAFEFPDSASSFVDVEALAQDRAVRVIAPERIKSPAAVDGPELRLRREALGLTQARMAEELGVSANTVARWERGDMTIENPRLVSLALAALSGTRVPAKAVKASRPGAASLMASGGGPKRHVSSKTSRAKGRTR